MAYTAPYIDENGLHIPSYTDIRDYLIDQMKVIFGDDIYIDIDTMDYQQISIFAKKIYDTNSLLQLVYNNRTPITSVGVGLDNLAVFGNIKRKPATSSTVQLTLTGVAGSVINNGEASDGTNFWELPPTVTIPDNGTIIVEATSKEPGNIQALPNTINQIITPVYGWYSVTNNYSASPGVDIESDAALRARFSLGTQMTSDTVFDGIIGRVYSVSGVTRCRGYENDTGQESTESVPGGGVPPGLPAHSITLVVEGGEDVSIASAIYLNKTPGCYTNGTTEVTITSESGNVNVIRFYRPTYKNVYVQVKLLKLSGYNDEYAVKIKKAISDYILGMQIAENVYRSIIWSVATSAMDDINTPAFSVQDIQFGTTSGSYTPADVIVDFYNAANTTVDMISVVEVTK